MHAEIAVIASGRLCVKTAFSTRADTPMMEYADELAASRCFTDFRDTLWRLSQRRDIGISRRGHAGIKGYDTVFHK